MKRQCKNWLKTLAEYAEETESPRDFWLWSGIFTLAATLQRRCWTPFGMDRIYPNIYVMLVAQPGWCRKSPPIKFAKKIMTALELPVYVDSPSKRAFTQKLDQLSKRCHFQIEGVPIPQAPLACISPELSTFMAIDIKAMTEILTDIYDSPDMWEYQTSGAGEDKVRAPAVSCFFATTPMWIARNLPEEAFGGGFTSRFVICAAVDRYKDVPLPPSPPPHLYNMLLEDLNQIKDITGEFSWDPEALAIYKEWYGGIRGMFKWVKDDKVQPFLSRIHTIGIKAAMALHVAYSDSLVLSPSDISLATGCMKRVVESAPIAFMGHGRSRSAQDTDRIMVQLKAFKQLSFKELLRINYRNTNKAELTEILENLEAMGQVERAFTTTGTQIITWKGGME